MENLAAPVKKAEINGRGYPLRRSQDTSLLANVGTSFSRLEGLSVGIVHLPTRSHGVSLVRSCILSIS
jgi:hypothetical protein